MKSSSFSLIDILYPRRFPSNPKRAAATRTISQPELDRYELADAAAGTTTYPAHAPVPEAFAAGCKLGSAA